MVNLRAYREYWEQYRQRLPVISRVVMLSVDEDISRTVQTILPTDTVLFVLVPQARRIGETPDSWVDRNEAVVIVAEKYDPQRGGSVSCLERLQPVAEALRSMIADDMAAGCPVLGRVDIGSMRVTAVTTWYNTLAGWMTDFTFDTD